MKNSIGYLEVIAGPMYCGKTEELIRQVKRATIGKRKVQVFKHSIDLRYGTEKKLFSHAGLSFDSELVGSAEELLQQVCPDTEIIAIDEAQWFGENLVQTIMKLLERGVHVVVAGLGLTYDRQPFIPMPTLMSIADKVTKLPSVCSMCGSDAVYHKRLIPEIKGVDALKTDPKFVTTLKDKVYEARCRNCWGK